MLRPLVCILLLASVTLFVPRVPAHPIFPSFLDLKETGDGRVLVQWRVPLLYEGEQPPKPLLPEGCREIAPAVPSPDDYGMVLNWVADCGGELAGKTIRIEGLAPGGLGAFVRVGLADGLIVSTFVTGEHPSMVITVPDSPVRIMLRYLRLGIEHLLTGPDHLLFVLGLFLLVHGARQLLLAITSFTLGHSVTLALAVLGFVRFPQGPIEVAIALSILVLGLELARRDRGSSGLGKRPWAMALAFGWLHGLGFAGALSQVGLPSDEIPVALLSFNVGIEVAQIFFVGALVLATLVIAPLSHRFFPLWSTSISSIAGYLIAAAGLFWAVGRTSALF